MKFLSSLALVVSGLTCFPAETMIAPQTHLIWATYPVGGMILVNPAAPDSTGTPIYARLPEGAVLCIPILELGRDPELKKGDA